MRYLAEYLGLEEAEEIEQVFKVTAETAEGLWNPEYGTKDLGPFDGSCLPKDLHAFVSYLIRTGADPLLLLATHQRNHLTSSKESVKPQN